MKMTSPKSNFQNILIALLLFVSHAFYSQQNIAASLLKVGNSPKEYRLSQKRIGSEVFITQPAFGKGFSDYNFSTGIDQTEIIAGQYITKRYNRLFRKPPGFALPPVIFGNTKVCFPTPGTTTLTGSGIPDPTTPWASSNTAVATINSSGVVTGIALGTTTITYTDNLGNNASANVTVNPLPVISGALTKCVGGTTQLTATTAPGAIPWTSSNPAVATVSNTGLVTGVTAGTSTITFQNSNGCTDSALVTINPLLVPTITCGAATTTQVSFNWTTVVGAATYTIFYKINGGTTTFGGSGPVLTYTVTGVSPSDVVTLIVTPSGAVGTCFASGTVNCAAMACTAAMLPATPVVAITQPTCSVATGDISITAVAGLTYNLDGGAFSGTLVYSGLASGAHTVKARNASGCTSTTNVTINPQPATPAAPTLTATQPTCTIATGTITITGVAGETYSLDGGAYVATLVYNGLPASSSHNVTAQSAAGCISPVSNISLNAQPPTPAAPTLTPTQPTCTVATGTITITAVAGETYSFDGGAYGAVLVFPGLPAGSSHNVYSKNASGCISAVSNITLNAQPPTPAAPALAPTQPTCTVATGTVTITGVAGLTYSFDAGAYTSTLVYSGLAAGSSHNVTAQNAFGCISAISNITLNAQPPTPAAPTLTPTQPTCTVATGTVTITAVAGLTYSFDGGPYGATLVFPGLPAGSSHTVTAKNAFGCISAISNITLNAQPPTPAAPTLTPTQPTCTVATGTITITAVAGETYSFDGGAYGAVLVFPGLPAGSSHNVYSKNASGCISAVSNITLNAQPPTPAAPALAPTQPTCTVATGTVTITGVAGLTYSFDAGAYTSTLVYSGLAAGSSHNVTAQNAFGCISAISNITLNAQPPTPAAPTLTPTQPTCTVATGTVTITAVAGLTYSFDGGPYGATLVFPGLPAGSSHTVTAKNAFGCISAISNITLNAQPPTPAAPTLTPTQPTCTVATGTITITAVAGETYSFDGGAYGAVLVFPGLPAGSSHNVYSKNASGCISAVSNITLNAQPPTPAAPALAPTQPTCTVATGTVTITGVAGLTYSFDAGAYTSTLVYSGLAAGSSHNVTAQNAFGCISAISNITLNAQPPTPAAPTLTPTQPTCTVATGTVTITAVAGLTYSFDGGPYGATLVFPGLPAGSSHTVTAKNAFGCISAISNITLNAQPPTPAAPTLTPTQPTCTVATGTITITAVAGETYSFDGGAYGAVLVFPGLPAGSSHNVYSKNASGCISAVSNITLNAQPPTPAAPALAPTQPTCTVATGTVTITGVAGLTYSFDAGAYTSTLVYSGLAAGSSHNVTAQNAFGCISAISNITLNAQPPTPAAPTLTPTQPTCTVATGTVTITAVAGLTYSFDGGPYGATLVFPGLPAGSSHTVTAKNAFGCISAISNITLNAQPPTPAAPTLTPTQPTCTVATGTITITAVAGETYSFDGGAYGAVLVFPGLPAGSSHNVYSKNASGCISAVSNITLNAQPPTPAAPALAPTQPTCTVATGTVTITGVAGLTYSFDAGAYTSTLVYSGLAAGSSHNVTAQNAFGCISAISNITLNAQPPTPAAPTLTPTQPTCTVATGTVTITAVAGLTYSFDGGPYGATLVFPGLPAGSSHTVTAKNAFGCISAISNITLNAQPPTPAAPTLTPTQPTCTVATGTITITAVAGETYSLDSGAYTSTLVYNGVAVGPHNVTAKNAVGCISAASNVTLNAQPGTPLAPTFTVTQPTCTVATGTVTINGVAGETYSFDSGIYSATLIYGGLPAGSSHTVTAQNATGCISPISNITLNAQPVTPSAPTLIPTQPTCTLAIGTITITGVAGLTYSFDSGAYNSTLIYSGLASGSSHTVTAQNAAGCISAVSNITLNSQPPTPAAPALTPTQPTCTVATGTITITGVAGETYSLDSGAYTSTLVYNGIAVGPHNVTAKNAAGCISAAANVTVNAQPGTPLAPTFTVTQPTCTVATGTVTINGVAGETYSFDSGIYSATLIYGGLPAGSSHTVTAQNATGCISPISNITLNAQPVTPSAPTLIPTQPTCTLATGTITITGVAGLTYSFDSGAYNSTLIYSGLASGSSHTVTAQNAAGCISAVSNITLNSQPPTPAAPALTPTQPTCTVATGTITITGVAGETYSLDSGAYTSTLVYNGIAVGPHNVTAKNAAGCISAAANVTVNAQPGTPLAPTFTVTQPTCTVATGTVTINGVAGETYSFDGSAFSGTLVYGGLAVGPHNVIAKNTLGCISTASNVTLNVQPGTPLAPALTIIQPTCAIATGNIVITGVAGETYSFDSGTYSATLTYNAVAPGVHTVTAKNATGCISPPSTVTINAQPATPSAPILTVTQPTCTVATATVTIIGITGLTYSFDGSAYSATLTYGGLPAASLHTVTAKNSAGCISTVSNVSLNAQPVTPSPPTLTATQPTCTVATGTVTITAVAGLTYSFDAGTYSSILTYSGLAAGSSHTVTAKNAVGCISLASAIAINAQPQTPVASALPVSPAVCTGNSPNISLSSNIAGTTFTWTVVQNNVSGASGGTGTLINQALSLTGSTIGTAIYTIIPSRSQCTGNAITVTVTVNPLPAPVLSNGKICIDKSTGTTVRSFTLNTQLGNANYSFEWYYEGNVIVSAHQSTYEAELAGLYAVIATNNLTGCISIPVSAIVTAAFAGETIETETSNAFSDDGIISVVVSPANPDYQYKLDDGPLQDSNVFEGVPAGSHTVTVIDVNGCTNLTADALLINYPKYFTPNGDGIHDTWNIIGIDTQPDAQIFIFDRYGKLMKQISPAGEGWDGKRNGHDEPADDYWFTAQYHEKNQSKEFKGHFAIKR